MTRDLFIKKMVSEKICMNPLGIKADVITKEQFEAIYKNIFASILEVGKSNITAIRGSFWISRKTYSLYMYLL